MATDKDDGLQDAQYNLANVRMMFSSITCRILELGVNDENHQSKTRSPATEDCKFQGTYMFLDLLPR